VVVMVVVVVAAPAFLRDLRVLRQQPVEEGRREEAL